MNKRKGKGKKCGGGYYVVALILCLGLVGCATWKQNTVKSYRLTGVALTQIQESGKDMCNKGVLKAEDCAKIKDIYNKARDVYIQMGNALILAIETEDAIQRKAKLDEYAKLSSQYLIFSNELIQLAYKYGILKGGK